MNNLFVKVTWKDACGVSNSWDEEIPKSFIVLMVLGRALKNKWLDLFGNCGRLLVC